MAFLVSPEEVPLLWKSLGKWTPACLPIYYLIKNSFKTENQWPSIKIFIDSSDLETLTSVVCCCENLDPTMFGKCYYLYSRDFDKLKVLLQHPGVIDWTKSNISFSLIPISAVPVLVEVGRQHGFQSSIEEMYHTYTLANIDTIYKVSTYEIPSNFSLGPLRSEHSSMLQTTWQYGAPPSMERFQKAIEYMPTLAIYNDKGNPVSWAVIKECGDVGLTYTAVEYQLQGFTSIVTASLVKLLLEQGETSYVVISDSDTASILVHTKLGFRRHDDLVTAWFTFIK
ncbi:glycine N-acyltransferase-like [Glandiceps talaboti]